MKKKLSENEVIFHFNLNKNYGNLSFKDLEEISDVRKKIKKSIDIIMKSLRRHMMIIRVIIEETHPIVLHMEIMIRQ